MQQQAIEVGTRDVQTTTSCNQFVEVEAHAVLTDGGFFAQRPRRWKNTPLKRCGRYEGLAYARPTALNVNGK